MTQKPELQLADPSEGPGDFLRNLVGSMGAAFLFGAIMGCLLIFAVGVFWWGIPPTFGAFLLTGLVCGCILAAFYGLGAVIRQMKN